MRADFIFQMIAAYLIAVLIVLFMSSNWRQIFKFSALVAIAWTGLSFLVEIGRITENWRYIKNTDIIISIFATFLGRFIPLIVFSSIIYSIGRAITNGGDYKTKPDPYSLPPPRPESPSDSVLGRTASWPPPPPVRKASPYSTLADPESYNPRRLPDPPALPKAADPVMRSPSLPPDQIPIPPAARFHATAPYQQSATPSSKSGALSGLPEFLTSGIFLVFFLIAYFPGGTITMALSCNSRRLDGWDWVLSVIIPMYGALKALFYC